MSVVHPVATVSAVLCVICSLLKFVSDAIHNYIVETYSCMGLVIALYVASIISFCCPHVVDVSASIFCIVWRVFVVVLSMCLYTLVHSLSSSVTFLDQKWKKLSYCDIIYHEQLHSYVYFSDARVILQTAFL